MRVFGLLWCTVTVSELCSIINSVVKDRLLVGNLHTNLTYDVYLRMMSIYVCYK